MKRNTIIVFIILFIFWFLFQIIMEELYSRVYKISTIGHMIVAFSFSIICTFLYYKGIVIKEQKTQKYFIKMGVFGALIFLFFYDNF